jgi:hypothetical protein
MRLDVELATLQAAAAKLRDAVGVARAVAEERASVTAGAEDCGSAKLGAALSDFVEEWGYGMGLVVEDAEKLAKMLEAAAAGYGQVASAIAREL